MNQPGVISLRVTVQYLNAYGHILKEWSGPSFRVAEIQRELPLGIGGDWAVGIRWWYIDEPAHAFMHWHTKHDKRKKSEKEKT